MKTRDKVVTVPDAIHMDDETFIKHLVKRHAADIDGGVAKHPHIVSAWVDPYRAYHERMHALEVGEHYDHVHI